MNANVVTEERTGPLKLNPQAVAALIRSDNPNISQKRAMNNAYLINGAFRKYWSNLDTLLDLTKSPAEKAKELETTRHAVILFEVAARHVKLLGRREKVEPLNTDLLTTHIQEKHPAMSSSIAKKYAYLINGTMKMPGSFVETMLDTTKTIEEKAGELKVSRNVVLARESAFRAAELMEKRDWRVKAHSIPDEKILAAIKGPSTFKEIADALDADPKWINVRLKRLQRLEEIDVFKIRRSSRSGSFGFYDLFYGKKIAPGESLIVPHNNHDQLEQLGQMIASDLNAYNIIKDSSRFKASLTRVLRDVKIPEWVIEIPKKRISEIDHEEWSKKAAELMAGVRQPSA